jgi:uncharacterized membrane protein (DUF441 family)
MVKAFVDVFTWIALVVGLFLAVLIGQTVLAYLRHDSAVAYSYIWRLVTGLFG